MKYNYIIIEDNPGALQNIQIALNQYVNYANKGTATSFKDGVSLILTEKPQLVFLDVELGNKNGFDIINEIRPYFTVMPFIIMTTDFESYAKKAVNNDILYFLDKPIDPDELVIALAKFEKNHIEKQNHITIKNSEGHFFIPFENISYIESDDNCCVFHKTNDAPQFVTKTLKEMEKILPIEFVRIHKSYIVNKNFILMLNTNKKKIILKLSHQKNGEHKEDNHNKKATNPEKLELPIGESYLEIVKNTLLTAKQTK